MINITILITVKVLNLLINTLKYTTSTYYSGENIEHPKCQQIMIKT